MRGRTSFVRFVAGFFLITTGANASCPIELSPSIVVVRYGDPISINCSTSESQLEGLGWESTVNGISLKHVNHLTWTTERLTKWTLSPLCFFNPSLNSSFQQCSEKAKVVQYTFPETIDISSSAGPHVEMREMKEYNITCHIDNVAPIQNLTVRWYRGDVIVQTQSFNNSSLIPKPVNATAVFPLTPTRKENGTTFRCEAHLDLGPDGPEAVLSQEYKVTVQFGPEIQCSLTTKFMEGETLKKHCPVIGNPTPFVSWQKDGKNIDPTIPLKREDAGMYTVEAEGASLKSLTLHVLVHNEPELQCPSNYTVLEHAPNNLTCNVVGYPKPEITWYKDGEEVHRPETLRRSDAGQYIISASNTLLSVNVTVDIYVIYPPSQIAELEDSEVDVGSKTRLKCSSVGNPRPKYIWNYYRTDNVMEENEDGVSRLIIHNASAHNMGSYTCHAWNDIGNVSKTVRVTVKGAKQECPIEITPGRMVIEYQSRDHHATCRPTFSGSRNEEGKIFWQSQKDTKINSAEWFLDIAAEWDLRPVCTATFKGIGPCQKHLNFTLYKRPDSVSIHHGDNESKVVEDREFQLQCNIANVAPARNLVVRWYKGNESLETHGKGSVRMSGCRSKKSADCDISVIRSPLNMSSTISVTLDRTQSLAEFRCEALLDLGPDGPQPPPLVMSSPLNLSVYSKPIINTTKLPSAVPVFRGYPEKLVCEADGHPTPRVQWLYSSDRKVDESGATLTVYESGFYNCSATNEVDSVWHQVQVILEEDYLPIIAGLVAVTVVVTSIIFVFIYSIYYKNTKMRRYSIKNPKLSNHNGNVAHNGWDSQFPMTKLY